MAVLRFLGVCLENRPSGQIAAFWGQFNLETYAASARDTTYTYHQEQRVTCALIADDSALSAFDFTSARLAAVRRRPGGGPVDGPRLPGARNGGS